MRRLGEYFDVDPVIMRVLFVLLAFFGGSRVYPLYRLRDHHAEKGDRHFGNGSAGRIAVHERAKIVRDRSYHRRSYSVVLEPRTFLILPSVGHFVELCFSNPPHLVGNGDHLLSTSRASTRGQDNRLASREINRPISRRNLPPPQRRIARSGVRGRIKNLEVYAAALQNISRLIPRCLDCFTLFCVWPLSERASCCILR